MFFERSHYLKVILGFCFTLDPGHHPRSCCTQILNLKASSLACRFSQSLQMSRHLMLEILSQSERPPFFLKDLRVN